MVSTTVPAGQHAHCMVQWPRAVPPAWSHRCSKSLMRLHILEPAWQAAWHAAICAVAVVRVTSCWQRHKALVPCASAQTCSLPQLCCTGMGVPHVLLSHACTLCTARTLHMS